MITLPAGARILLGTRPVDFREGAHSLAALAAEMVGEDPFPGAVPVFRSERAGRIELAAWDGSGLVLVWKHLEAGAFRRPPVADGALRRTPVEFAALFDGIGRARVRSAKRIPGPGVPAQNRPRDARGRRSDAAPARRSCGVARAAAGGLGGAGRRGGRARWPRRRARCPGGAERAAAAPAARAAAHAVRPALGAARREPAAIRLRGGRGLDRRHRGREALARPAQEEHGPLPEHLPRAEQVPRPESTACPCCQGKTVEIGCDAAERFDAIPVQ